MTAVSTSRSRTVVERCRRQTLTGAKALFMKAVREGVENLMQQYGYSRDRASTTLLRELARGETGPTEDEVFHMMTHQGVGLEAATQALTVSKALQRLMKERAISAVEAIDDLTARLGFTNLMLLSDDEFDDQVQENYEILRPRTATPVKRLTQATPMSTTSDKQRMIPPSSRKCPLSKKLAKGKTETFKGKTTATPKGSRKRAISGTEQDVTTSQGESKVRARTDSVAEVVNAKMAAIDTGSSETIKPVAPLRGKRRGADDAKPEAAPQTTTKRQRTGEA